MKEDFDDLKNMYQQKKSDRVTELAPAKNLGDDQLKKLKYDTLKNIFVFAFTGVAIFYIDKVSSEKVTTSAAGFWILMGCAIYYAAAKAYLFYKLNEIKPTLPVLTAIEKLETYKKLNTFLLTYGELIYVILLSVGVYLYLQPVFALMGINMNPKYLKFLKFIWLAYLLWAFYNTFFIKRKKLIADNKLLTTLLQSLKNN